MIDAGGWVLCLCHEHNAQPILVSGIKHIPYGQSLLDQLAIYLQFLFDLSIQRFAFCCMLCVF